MRNNALSTVFMIILSIGLLNAQTEQGKILIGISSTLSVTGSGTDLLNIGYTSVKSKSDASDYVESDPTKITSINLSPRVGYFIADNFAIGLDLNVASSTIKDSDDDKFSTTMFNAGPFVRYYIRTSSFIPFIELNGALGSVNSKYSSEVLDKSSVMSFGGGIGIASPLGDRVIFDVLAGYNSLTLKDKEDNDDNYRTIMGSIGLKVGFTISLGS